jgi:hypothetical protein
MTDAVPATVASTRQLLDGALAVAEREAAPDTSPPLSQPRWAWSLANQWYCAHHSVALLPSAIDRFEAAGRGDLAGFARLKLDEESGHDAFTLNDLEALGCDAEAAVRSLVPAEPVAAGLEYARCCIEGEEPVEFLGYVYALERHVLRLSAAWFEELDAVLPPGVEAASGVRAHATELDSDHIAEAVAFIAGLPARDRIAITRSAHRITAILCEPFRPPTEAELEGWLSRVTRDRSGPTAQRC